MKKPKKEIILRICIDLDSDFQKLANYDNRSKSKEMIIALYSYLKKVKAKQPQIFNSESQSESNSVLNNELDNQMTREEWNEFLESIDYPFSESTSHSESDFLDVAPTTKKGRKKKIKYEFSFSGSDSQTLEDYLKEDSHEDFIKWAESLTSENKNGQSDS